MKNAYFCASGRAHTTIVSGRSKTRKGNRSCMFKQPPTRNTPEMVSLLKTVSICRVFSLSKTVSIFVEFYYSAFYVSEILARAFDCILYATAYHHLVLALKDLEKELVVHIQNGTSHTLSPFTNTKRKPYKKGTKVQK